MMDIFKRPVVIIIIFVAIIGAIVWSYVDKVSTEKAAKEAAEQAAQSVVITDLTTVDPAEYDPVVRSEYATARTKATEVSAEYKLSALSVEIPADLGLKSPTVRYIFSTTSKNDYNFLVTFSESSGNYIRALIPKVDYMGELTSINTSLWAFNWVTALQIAEKDGGANFRESNSLSGITLTMKVSTDKNWLLWDVSYTAGAASFERMIDAKSGKIITE